VRTCWWRIGCEDEGLLTGTITRRDELWNRLNVGGRWMFDDRKAFGKRVLGGGFFFETVWKTGGSMCRVRLMMGSEGLERLEKLLQVFWC